MLTHCKNYNYAHVVGLHSCLDRPTAVRNVKVRKWYYGYKFEPLFQSKIRNTPYGIPVFSVTLLHTECLLITSHTLSLTSLKTVLHYYQRTITGPKIVF